MKLENLLCCTKINVPFEHGEGFDLIISTITWTDTTLFIYILSIILYIRYSRICHMTQKAVCTEL